MKIIDITGNKQCTVGFYVDKECDGTITGRLEVCTNLEKQLEIGQHVPAGVGSLSELKIKFDKPESIAVFISQLQNGYDKLSILQGEKLRKEGVIKKTTDHLDTL